jgi:hypothetical protein
MMFMEQVVFALDAWLTVLGRLTDDPVAPSSTRGSQVKTQVV